MARSYARFPRPADSYNRLNEDEFRRSMEIAMQEIARDIISGALGAEGAVAQGTPGARAELTSDFTVSTGSETTVDWDEVAFDDDSYWDNGDPERLTVSSDGLYLIHTLLVYEGAGNFAAGNRVYSRLYKNGAAVALHHEVAGTTQSLISTQLTYLDRASAGDYYDVRTFQNAGADRDIDETRAYFHIHRIGD